MISPVLAANGQTGAVLAQGGGRAKWYLAGGAPTPVAAYQPKGSSSLAASYVNLANPGTFDAAPGVAPTWNSTDGWVFNGTKYLTTGIVPDNDQTWAMIVRFSGVTITNKIMISASSGDNAPLFELGSLFSGSRFYANSLFRNGGIHPTSGVTGIGGKRAYLNGVDEGFPDFAFTAGSMNQIFIGGRNGATSFVGNIQAVAIYSSTLTAGQVAAVSAAMAAL